MYYHASPAAFEPGDEVVPGKPANFSSVPGIYVFLSDNLESAEFWEEFLGGESQAEKLGYWPDVFLYEVKPTGYIEPDPWCTYYDVPGCFMSLDPLTVVRKIR